MYKKILVPLDGSELSEGTLPLAKMIAQRTGAELILLTVVAQETEAAKEDLPQSERRVARRTRGGLT